MAGLSDTAVATRAYLIWEKQGRPHGRDKEHWLQAVAELSAAPPKAKVKAKPAKPAAPVKAVAAKVTPISRTTRKG